jgi:hypothetical protein
MNVHLSESRTEADQQLMSGQKLLETLFQAECRPTLRWLRDQQKARRIPFVKIGRLVFFCPAQVRQALQGK